MRRIEETPEGWIAGAMSAAAAREACGIVRVGRRFYFHLRRRRHEQGFGENHRERTDTCGSRGNRTRFGKSTFIDGRDVVGAERDSFPAPDLLPSLQELHARDGNEIVRAISF